MILLAFVLGLFVGACAGVMLAGMAAAAGQADDRAARARGCPEERLQARQNLRLL